mgnify:CR=1 FL=1
MQTFCIFAGYVNNMLRQQITFLLSIMLTVCMLASAQNNTSSPYSRFGYGELNDNVPGAYRALGSVSTGMRSKYVIAPAQPASYSAVDSTSFMFDIGASLIYSNYGDALGKKNKINGNLEYFTIQFPIWKYIGFSLGIEPFSMVGYEITDSVTNTAHPYQKLYTGTGGITQLYGGLSFNILNWVAIGANVYYMFGNVYNSRLLSFNESNFTSVLQVSSMHVSDVRFRYGLQLFHSFRQNHYVVIGATFENKSKLNGDFTLQEVFSSVDSTITNINSGFDLPMMFSVGASYNYANRLTIAFDFWQTQWANIKYMDLNNQFNNRNKYSFGVEYRHNPDGRKYVERMPFRLGLSVATNYEKSIIGNEYILSIGTAFPLRNVNTQINATLEYGHRGSNQTLREDFLRFSINASINERWFIRRKL